MDISARRLVKLFSACECFLSSRVPDLTLPHWPLAPLRLLFRYPEFGHELDTKSAEGPIASGGGAVIGVSVRRSFHATSMMVRATPATRNTTTPVANVIGDWNTTNRPNTRSHMGTIAARLKSIDMVISFFLVLGTVAAELPPERPAEPTKQGGRGRPADD